MNNCIIEGTLINRIINHLSTHIAIYDLSRFFTRHIHLGTKFETSSSVEIRPAKCAVKKCAVIHLRFKQNNFFFIEARKLLEHQCVVLQSLGPRISKRVIFRIRSKWI